MAKGYKKKHEQEEVVLESGTLSKKELYDLEKKNRLALQEKELQKKTNSLKKKKDNKIGFKIFAITVLVLMIGSVVVSVLAPVLG